MAKANTILIDKLKEAAENIESGAAYNWGHVGRCNCGHILQAISPMSPGEIYQRAQVQQLDEWSEYAHDYCPESGAPMDILINKMIAIGMGKEDIIELEYLSNKRVLKALPGGFRYLRKGSKQDAVLYMKTWAKVLEEELNKIPYPEPVLEFA